MINPHFTGINQTQLKCTATEIIYIHYTFIYTKPNPDVNEMQLRLSIYTIPSYDLVSYRLRFGLLAIAHNLSLKTIR
jgi:hypothetical protein